MSIDKTDLIFYPAFGSDYCVITVANRTDESSNGVQSILVVLVEEGGDFPTFIDDEKDIFLEAFNPSGGKVTEADIFDAVTELRAMKETYLPVRISYGLYVAAEEFFSRLFSKVITAQYDDFPQSECKH